MWQAEVGSGTNRATDYRDWTDKFVTFLTSQGLATVAVNAGGTGYVVGDELTLTHAGAYLDAKVEVTSVSSGVITGLRINCSGAFSNRVATVAVNAGGTGYAVNDIVSIQGGTSRAKAKAQVTSVSGGVVTGVSVFESGGSYSVAPGLTGATTLGVGPSGFAGDDALTLNLTMTGLIGTTGLSVTGGTGSGATVNITLSNVGWSVDSRDNHDFSHNSLTDEKQVTLVADAVGSTNKPYAHIITGTETVGLDTRYFVGFYGSVAHNSGLEVYQQPGISPGIGSSGFVDSGGYLLFPQNQVNEVDLWFQADDSFVFFEINCNPVANTDDGQYLNGLFGFGNRLATETEDPYPMLLGAGSRDRDANPANSSTSITGVAECRAPSTGPYFYYNTDSAGWVQIKNNDAGSVNAFNDVMFPFGEIPLQNNVSSAEYVVLDGPLAINDNIIKRDRSASTVIFDRTPGTVNEYFLMPLFVVKKDGTTFNESTDGPRLEVPKIFWVYNDDGAGSAITNFSEDYITIGSNRYRVFHNHVHTERYQYIAVLEDV